MFLKEKRNENIKALRCADRNKQRKKYKNSDVMSPPVSKEVVLIFAMIDAYEERDVAVLDVPVAYLSSDMDYDVFMIVCGTMAELMVSDNPTFYCKYI